MTKLSRIPRLLLLPALCLAACTADEPASLNADGQALVIEDLRIAGSNTRADAQPIEGSFVEGSRLQATITYDGQTSTGLYTYNNNVWTPDANDPAYWLTGGKQSVTLRTPVSDPIGMPDEFTADNWHEYDILEYSGQTAPTTSFTLRHMRAQLCVTLTAGTGLTDADLDRAEVTIKDSNTELWHTNGAHYALLDPATYASLPALTITLGSETYTYNPGTDASAPTAGECLMLTLSVSKAQVSALSTTSTGWQELTATGTEVAGVTVLYCPTPGSLSTTNNLDNLSGRVYVTGTINNDDLNALTDKLASVTHLYIVAESGVTGGLTVPTQFAFLNTSLQAVAILHATSIGDYAFSSCTSLTSIDLPKAETIGDYAFDNCASLTSIDLPKAETIGDNTFGVCTNLESIDLPQATGIGSSAFQGCSGLTSIDLPAAETIGDYAFDNCASLTSIDLPKATSIGSNAFNMCSSLTSIDLPAATRIGSYAFYSCEKLGNINLPAANDIGIEAFAYCTSLKNIAVPSTTVGSNIFYRSSTTTTLFLTDEGTTEDTAAGLANWGGAQWQTIYYGYRGSGDYLDPGSYEGQWTPSN
ncbi:MAG TPA: leucine-rich repeat protein [Candidatus Bacteroides merdipullorum]|uniref:Leucine-rich repeat protein n=1 Tax=Candidatus Bacteroides merdipullorum TaxID=2838474 RepID=A0A9D2A705_9BACE|nr:leucine-rich repeat protein [Candidatus Bacteroides merdipullorum]